LHAETAASKAAITVIVEPGRLRFLRKASPSSVVDYWRYADVSETEMISRPVNTGGV
jgi:hypothetical protein